MNEPVLITYNSGDYSTEHSYYCATCKRFVLSGLADRFVVLRQGTKHMMNHLYGKKMQS